MVTRLPTNWTQWLGAVLGSVLVGLAGVLPLAVVPASKLGGGAGAEDGLKYLLGFAAGGLLGDVFLHLLPETKYVGDALSELVLLCACCQ